MASPENLAQVLDHLGLGRAHFVAAFGPDIAGFAARYPDRVASLTFVNPFGWLPDSTAQLGSRVQAILGDTGDTMQRMRAALSASMIATFDLNGAAGAAWDDVASTHRDAILQPLLAYAAQYGGDVVPVSLVQNTGAIGDVTYAVIGAGAPLVLLPLGLSPSQWDPIIAELAQRFTVVTLRGRDLGFVQLLEARFPSPGYEMVLRTLIAEVCPKPGERVLEVGCGCGTDTRWLAQNLDATTSITAVDLNGYLLSEARALAEAEGVGGRIEFREGSALSLPFPDGSFDVTLSVTMLEELDADSALAELVRVTRPGGRVVVAVRAVDLPLVVNMTTDERIRAQVEAPGFGTVSPTGCADASLYQRMRAAGLTGGRFFPAYSTSSKPDVLPASGLPARLGPPDREVYLSAVHKAIEAGTFYASQQLHCAWG